MRIYLLNEEGKNMRSNISMWLEVVLVILENVRIKNLDYIQWGLVVLAEGNVVRHSLPIILKNTIKMN